jgi:alpha,alpha-trehalase
MSDVAMTPRRLPLWALGALPDIDRRIGARRPVFFLDLDGTLAPITERPDLVELPSATRDVLSRLLQRHVVCLISGRGLADLRRVVGLESAYYAANHGYEIVGPPGSGILLEVGAVHRDMMETVAARSQDALRSIDGTVIEDKGLSIAVHYRLVPTAERPAVERIVKDVIGSFPSLRVLEGKLVYDLLPPGMWDKGHATTWLLERLGCSRDDACPVCLGDDLTDEDMFTAVNGWGVSVVVGSRDRPTRAGYWLRDGGEAATFLDGFTVERGRREPQSG